MKDKRGVELSLDDTVVYAARNNLLKYGRVWEISGDHISIVFPPGTYKSESVCVLACNVLKVTFPEGGE